jgi:hypothetical protein
MPPVRLASRDELAAAARVAPLIRVARDLAAWAGTARPLTAGAELTPADTSQAAGVLDLSPDEVQAAWAVATGTGMAAVSGSTGSGTPVSGSTGSGSTGSGSTGSGSTGSGSTGSGSTAGPGERLGVLDSGPPEAVLNVWCGALQTILRRENLDGLATALYTAGRPVRLDALFEAYAAAVGALTVSGEGDAAAGDAKAGPPESGHAFSPGLELLADLGVIELGAEGDEDEAGLTVSLSPLGLWAVRERLSERGWRVPVLGGSAGGGAAAVLAVLADYDAEDGEAEIAAWLARRAPERAAEELTEAASTGSPGLRGAAFAVMDRVGDAAVPAVRRAMDNPVLRPHAAVWLREHGAEEVSLSREDSAWLLVDLGAGLLEEAAPDDVVAELLPELPPHAQAELVAGLWRVDHPGVTELLTTLSDHHPEPDVAKAARKAAFKARSRL